MEGKYSVFDKKDIFEEEIEETLKKLTSLLRHYEIPYFFAIALKSDAEGTEYDFESHDEWISSCHMKDDKIPKFINVVNGFKTVLPGSIAEVEL